MFFIGQKVHQWDADDKQYKYGEIVAIKENSISVQWHDRKEPLEHFEIEYNSIKQSATEVGPHIYTPKT